METQVTAPVTSGATDKLEKMSSSDNKELPKEEEEEEASMETATTTTTTTPTTSVSEKPTLQPEIKPTSSDQGPSELDLLEKQFDRWQINSSSQNRLHTLVWVGENDESSLIVEFESIEIVIYYPTKHSSDSIFYLKTNDRRSQESIALLNERLVDMPEVTFTQVLSMIQRHFSVGRQKKRRMALSQSQGSEKEQESDDEQDEDEEEEEMETFVVDEEAMQDFSKENFLNPHMKLVLEEMNAAREIVGDNVVPRGQSSVIITTDISDAVNPALCSALELTMNEPILVTMDFIDLWGLASDSTKLPMPKFSTRQWTTQDSNSFGIKYHVREIVSRYIEDNWKWTDPSTRQELVMPNFTADKGQNNKFKFGGAPAAGPASGRSKFKQAIDKLVTQFTGFDRGICASVLKDCNNDVDEATEALVKMQSAHPKEGESDTVKQLAAMGYPMEAVVSVLAAVDNDIAQALAILTSTDFGPQQPSTTTHAASGRGSLVQSKEMDEDRVLAERLAKEEEELMSGDGNGQKSKKKSVLSHTDTNFFIGLMGYIRARLSNYTRFCMICHKRHQCGSDRPVICCNPLCIFRYADLLPPNKKERVNSSLQKLTICPFTDCEASAVLSENDAVLATLFGSVVLDTGSTQQMMLQMRGHRYLPNSQVLAFLEEGVKQNNMTIKTIENVLKPELVIGFEASWERLKSARGSGEAQPRLAYHGTAEHNIDSILDKGLLVPGQDKAVGHATDTGWWGKGIYLSPNHSLSVGYCRGGKKLLLCAVTMGKIYKCSSRIDGGALQVGYDSHEDPSGQEYVLFDNTRVLPCYLVTFN
eukprot:TRINITY_DN49_c1_g1_i1.p1 TRINITY_DN49_c1_g1~~TRINITY_DN49_c1_g1_i1.p1  ORF type:complete len:816 (+),score=176.19 TRINITY_DN49_c1_g1_i1:2-2449(+)